MKSELSFSVAERREAKRRSRERDLARLDSGKISASDLHEQNGFFSSLDRSRVRIAERRVRVNLSEK